jgi:hypothetical protein
LRNPRNHTRSPSTANAPILRHSSTTLRGVNFFTENKPESDSRRASLARKILVFRAGSAALIVNFPALNLFRLSRRIFPAEGKPGSPPEKLPTNDSVMGGMPVPDGEGPCWRACDWS